MLTVYQSAILLSYLRKWTIQYYTGTQNDMSSLITEFVHLSPRFRWFCSRFLYYEAS